MSSGRGGWSEELSKHQRWCGRETRLVVLVLDLSNVLNLLLVVAVAHQLRELLALWVEGEAVRWKWRGWW